MQLNQSIAIPATTFSPFDGPSSNSRAVNSLFYTSLGFSLANVTIGLLCLQWIRSLGTECPGIGAESFLIFRYRRNRAFEAWGAKGTILALPLLLLMSLLSFFTAMLFYVSSEDWAVASPLYAILLALLAVIWVTTFAPAIVNLWYALSIAHWPKDVLLPPFHSLQSWIVLQGLINCIRLLYHFADREVPTAIETLHSVSDWVEVDQFWADWLPTQVHRRASILFPLKLSLAKRKWSELIFHCYSDLLPEDKSMGGCSRRLAVYRHIAQNSKSFVGTTLLRVQDELVRHLIGLLNSGTRLENLGPLTVENDMHFYFLSPGIVYVYLLALNLIDFQALCALIHAFGRESPSTLNEDHWELLWSAMAACVQHADKPCYASPWTLPPLLRDCFDLVERHLGHPEVDIDTIDGVGYLYFVVSMRLCLENLGYCRVNPVGRKVVTTVIRHRAWTRMSEITVMVDRATLDRIQVLTAPFVDFIDGGEEQSEVKHCVYLRI